MQDLHGKKAEHHILIRMQQFLVSSCMVGVSFFLFYLAICVQFLKLFLLFVDAGPMLIAVYFIH